MTGADPATTALHWSLALLDGLITAGVRLLVLSPGSRSTPVVLAAQQRPPLQLIPIVDERAAAFFALGAAKVSHQPVALLATSGSAPAHWYPAVIEAAEWGVPLVLLSADRPTSERQLGVNQTIDQTRLFGVFVREFHEPGVPDGSAANLRAAYALGLRAATRAQQPRPGAVHLNLSFVEPLVPPVDSDLPAPAAWPVTDAAAPSAVVSTAAAATIAPPLTLPAGRGLLLCGPGDDARDMEQLWAATARHGLPVLTDPLSGLRFGTTPAGQLPTTRIAGYDAIVRQPQYAQQLRPDWVLRLGRAPVSKRVTQWLADVPTLLVSADGSWHDPTHAVRWHWALTPAALCQQLLATAPASAADAAWLAQWQHAERQMTAITAEALAQAEWCEAHVIAHLLATIPANEGLLCANSLPIRQLETWSLAIPNAALTVYGNRGVSGIDGQLATLAGMNHAQPTWGLCGDLSFCHDLGGLLLARHWTRPLYVINNGGGRIFDYLPQQRLAGLETLWRLPPTIDFAQLARSFHLPYWRVDNRAALQQLPVETAALIEIVIDADDSARVQRTLWQNYETADVNTNNLTE